MLIDMDDYVGPWESSPDWTPDCVHNAAILLKAVDDMAIFAQAQGIEFKTNPHTGTCVSGATFGGFRPQNCPEGAPNSSHKTGEGVDVYDPDGEFDDWLTDDILKQFNLYREAPESTRGWTHLTTRAPRSGKRTFMP